MIPVFHWNHSASKFLFSFCWYCLKIRCTEKKQQCVWIKNISTSTVDITITKWKQQFTCRTSPVKYWNHSGGKVLLSFWSNSWQRYTGIILTTKHWNYSTCFGPSCCNCKKVADLIKFYILCIYFVAKSEDFFADFLQITILWTEFFWGVILEYKFLTCYLLLNLENLVHKASLFGALKLAYFSIEILT